MDAQSWRDLMTQWNADLLQTPDVVKRLPEEVVASGWLGYPGATEGQLQRAEARLGIALPQSYREFLTVTNGWGPLGHFHWNLWPVEQVEWFRVRNQDWIDAYQEPAKGWDDTSEEAHRVYGPDQRDVDFRLAYLDAVLEVSDATRADSVILLLNPKVISPNGEWEAWDFGTWYPGAHRYRSFWEMMQALYGGFLRLRADREDR
jgi:SMI1/KNR4 family protein SUKH-1